MEIVYDESTGTWSEREEPYTTLDVQTEEDWNKLEFMINNFSKLEEENKELKRLLRLAVDDIAWSNCNMGDSDECPDCPYYSGKPGRCLNEWQHAEEAMKLLGDEGNEQ